MGLLCRTAACGAGLSIRGVLSYNVPTCFYFRIFVELGHPRPSMFLSLRGLKWVWLALGYFSRTFSLVRINRRSSDHNKITFENMCRKRPNFHRLVSKMVTV